MMVSGHNHEPTSLPTAHVMHRKLTDDMKEAIESMSMNPAVRVREIDIALQNIVVDTSRWVVLDDDS